MNDNNVYDLIKYYFIDYRKYNIPLWQEIIEKLLNSNFVSLSQLKQHLKQNTDWNEAGLRRLVCLGNS